VVVVAMMVGAVATTAMTTADVSDDCGRNRSSSGSDETGRVPRAISPVPPSPTRR
jgi:hypothetical protein